MPLNIEVRASTSSRRNLQRACAQPKPRP